MKKLILSSALVLALCLSFTSCREKKDADTTDGEAIENTVDETTGTAVETTEEAIDEVTETVEGAVEDTTEAVEEVKDNATKASEEVNKSVKKSKKDN